VPDPVAFLKPVLPELARRARASESAGPLELGLHVRDRKILLQLGGRTPRLELDKLGRRYLTLTSAAFTRLAMGHTDIEQAIEEDGVEPSTQTAIESARVLFPIQPIWRSPLDAGTA
jgi:hypothetical protein